MIPKTTAPLPAILSKLSSITQSPHIRIILPAVAPTSQILDLLPLPTRAIVLRYHRPADQALSLASALLKRFAISRGCGVPWGEVKIGTQSGGKPYFVKEEKHLEIGDDQDRNNKNRVTEERGQEERQEGKRKGRQDARRDDEHPNFKDIEFNSSHHGGIAVLAACLCGPRCGISSSADLSDSTSTLISALSISSNGLSNRLMSGNLTNSDGFDTFPRRRIGVDVVQVRLERDTTAIKSKGWVKWAATYSDIFSVQEMLEIIGEDGDTGSNIASESMLPSSKNQRNLLEADEMENRLRRFYTHWALKEAYVKMTGEGLVGEKVREAEVRDVRVPEAGSGELHSGGLVRNIQIWKAGKVLAGVKAEVRALGRRYLVATVVEGRGLRRERREGERLLAKDRKTGEQEPDQDEESGESEQPTKDHAESSDQEDDDEERWPPFEILDFERDILPLTESMGSMSTLP